MSGERERDVVVRFEVPFHDVDAQGVVWHGHYLKYFELARDALFRSRGLDLDFWRASPHQLVVVESRCRHTHPLRYTDRASVRARFLDVPGRVGVSYQVLLERGGVHVARGRTELAAIGRDGALAIPLPEALHARTRP